MSPSPPIAVALVNDYDIVVQGLAAMLKPYERQGRIDIVELAADETVGRQADIALYDTYAATRGDREQAHELADHPKVSKMVVYSWNIAPDLIDASLANGASGYIAKGLPAARLVGALEAIHRGDSAIHVGEGRTRTTSGDWPGRGEGLTQRESEILALISQGLSNEEIADHTNLSINSVKTYIRYCYRRIEVTSRTQAVVWGLDHGFSPARQG